MKASELVARQGKVDIELEVTDVGEIREFEKFGRTGKVATAVAKDDSGEIKLTLWNEQIEQVHTGDKIKITNGFVSEWQGEKQLSTGKFGTLEVVSGAKASEETPEQPDKAAETKETKSEATEPSEQPETKEEELY